MIKNGLDRTAGTALAMDIAWPAQDLLDCPGLLDSKLILGCLSCDPSTPETLPAGPSSEMASGPCYRSEISACEHAPGLPSLPLWPSVVFCSSRASSSAGAQPEAEVEVPLSPEALEPLPGFGETRIRSGTRRNIKTHNNT